MAQIFDPIPTDVINKIVCCYVNATSQIQIARITNIANWYFERVVFPGQRLIFETVTEAHLEIHTGMMASSILSDRVPCNQLRIHDELSPLVTLEEQQRIEQRNEGSEVENRNLEVGGASRSFVPPTAVVH
ncbi:MAG: DUF1830 domain-containing protein [Leptolyngbyaceae cyanobacterium]